MAINFPHVVFIVSTGNYHPLNYYSSISEIINHYPDYLSENENFNIINPATSALALTVGSIAQKVKITQERHGDENIKSPIAQENQPSPFTRTGVGINGMVKPELVEYGGNLILSEKFGRITEDIGGKIALLNNDTTEDIIQYDYGSSYATSKVAHLAGKVANEYPQMSANFIKNLLLVGADHPFEPTEEFYNAHDKNTAEKKHLSVCGYGLSDYERAINSYNNRTVLWDEGKINLNQLKIYSLDLPGIFFSEKGKKKIIITLTFNPETRSTRGDSYLGNRMTFHLFHSIDPQILIERFGKISEETEHIGVPDDLKKNEIKFSPGSTVRKAGCHQKAWKEYKRNPSNPPSSPISLVLLDFNKWISDANYVQDYCISVIFEHEKDIDLYNELRASIQTRARV